LTTLIVIESLILLYLSANILYVINFGHPSLNEEMKDSMELYYKPLFYKVKSLF